MSATVAVLSVAVAVLSAAVLSATVAVATSQHDSAHPPWSTSSHHPGHLTTEHTLMSRALYKHVMVM